MLFYFPFRTKLKKKKKKTKMNGSQRWVEEVSHAINTRCVAELCQSLPQFNMSYENSATHHPMLLRDVVSTC